MAKNTGIERSKNNPIELEKGGFLAYVAFQSIRTFNQLKFNTLPRIVLEE
jgi:hypothetical protein